MAQLPSGETKPGPPPGGRRDTLTRASSAAGRLLVLAVAVAAALWVLWTLRVVVIPVILAVFISTLLVPSAQWLREHKVPRGLATLIVCIGALVITGGIVTLLVEPTIAGFDDLTKNVGSALDQLQRLAQSVGLNDQRLQGLLDNAKTSFSSETVIRSATTAGEIVVGFVLAVVLAIYFIHDGDQLAKHAIRMLPPRRRGGVTEAASLTWHVISRYVRGVAIVGLADAIPVAIVLLVVGVPLVVPLAVITFVGAFLPVVGAFLSGAIAVLVALVAKGPVAAIIVLAAFVLVQQLESHILAPQVYGRSLDLHPVIILLAITLGSVVAGLIGAFLAAPVAAVIGALLRRATADDDPPPSPPPQTDTPDSPGEPAPDSA